MGKSNKSTMQTKVLINNLQWALSLVTDARMQTINNDLTTNLPQCLRFFATQFELTKAFGNIVYQSL